MFDISKKFFVCRRNGMNQWKSLFLVAAVALLFVGCESAEKYWNPELNEDVGELKGEGKLKIAEDEAILLMPVVLHIGASDAMNTGFQGKLLASAIASKGRFLPLDPVIPDEITSRMPNNHSLCCNFIWLARNSYWKFPEGSGYDVDFKILGGLMNDLMGLLGLLKDKLGIPVPPKIRYIAFVHVDMSSIFFGMMEAWNAFGGVWDLQTNQLARAFDFTKGVPPDDNLKIAFAVDLAGDLENLFLGPKEKLEEEAKAEEKPADQGGDQPRQ